MKSVVDLSLNRLSEKKMHQVTVFLVFVTLSLSVVHSEDLSCKSENSCTSLYSPICAFKGKINKTFSNKCELDVHNKCNKNDGKEY